MSGVELLGAWQAVWVPFAQLQAGGCTEGCIHGKGLDSSSPVRAR